jgi:hypothetical protein
VTAADWIKLAAGLVGGMFSIILGLLAAIWGQNRKQLEALEARHTACRRDASEEHRRLHERVNVVELRVSQHDVSLARLEERMGDAE